MSYFDKAWQLSGKHNDTKLRHVHTVYLNSFIYVEYKNSAFFKTGSHISRMKVYTCLLYTSDAADDMQCVDLGGRRIIKKCIFVGVW